MRIGAAMTRDGPIEWAESIALAARRPAPKTGHFGLGID
jgi:hypothetical protein